VSSSAFLLPAFFRLEQGHRDYNDRRIRADAIIKGIIGDLKDDPSPESDSADDPVWSWNGKERDGFIVSLRPLSDRLNLNFARKSLFETSEIASLFLPGMNGAKLRERREEKGLSLENSAWAEFFDVANIEKYFSNYTWAHINLIDGAGAERLADKMRGSGEGCGVLKKRLKSIAASQTHIDRQNLKETLGRDYEAFFPLLNAEPLINVHLAEPLILKALISYPAFRVRHKEWAYLEILRRREHGVLGPDDLQTIFGLKPESPLLQYLGTNTWFWEITIKHQVSGLSRKTIICRLPPENDHERSYSIIEERYEPCVK
jgi:hypothetical protein